jgi:hypothetical protein
MQFIASVYTIISERVVLLQGGSWSFIEGIRAMKPRTIVATVPIFSVGVAL